MSWVHLIDREGRVTDATDGRLEFIDCLSEGIELAALELKGTAVQIEGLRLLLDRRAGRELLNRVIELAAIEGDLDQAYLKLGELMRL